MAIPIVILLFCFIFLLLLGTNIVVVGLRRLAVTTHTGLFALSAILLALATSFPELSVAVTSGFSGVSSLSLGNILGANIANITLVTGGAALVAGQVTVRGKFLRREFFLAFAAGIIPLFLLFDGLLSRIDGLILMTVWGAYVAHFFKVRFIQLAKNFAQEGFWHRFLYKVEGTTGKETAKLLLGVAILLFSADIIVRLSMILAQDVGMPLLIVGAFILALGTTLPELVFSFRSLLGGQPTMFLGNILGSIIANSTLIVGIAALLSPIRVEPGKIIILGLAFVMTYILFWFFIRTKHRLDRWEAGILFAFYILFVVVMAR